MKKEKIKRIARRITAFAAAVAMAATFTFPAEIGNGFFSGFGNAIVASAASVSLDLANGSIVITDTGYSVGGSAETAYTGDYVIAGSCGANTGITVSGTQNITLDNVTINSDGVTPFKVLNGTNVTVNLVGSNAFGNGWDGVHTTNIVVEDNASLTFVGSGSLSCCESCEHNKMLIGNNAYVTIGASAAVVLRAAGAKTISGSGTLSIDGGTIKLRSDDYFTDGSIFENSVKVKVSSGTLEIYEKTGSNGFGAESVTLNGGTIKCDIASAKLKLPDLIINGGALDIPGGIEVVGTAVVNTNAVVSTNFEIPAGSTFTVSENGVLTISEQGKLTNNGTFENYGTVKNSGEIVNNTTVTGSGKILNENGGTTSGSGTYSTTPVTIGTDFLITPTNYADTLVYGTDYTYEGGVLKILSSKAITIANASSIFSSNKIVVKKDTNADITFNGVKITATTGAAFMIEDNSTGNVTITLADGSYNSLLSSGDNAGLQKNGTNGLLTITGSGTLYSEGNTNGAGTGSGKSQNCSNITIESGIITAISSNGEGIGIGYSDSDNTTSGIIITGGSVKASSIGCTPSNGTDDVFLREIANAGCTAAITINNNTNYPTNHSGEEKIYAYLPAKSLATPNVIKVGENTTECYYDTVNSKWIDLIDAAAIEITEPSAGSALATSATVTSPTTGVETITPSDIIWKDASDSVVSGTAGYNKEYTVYVTLTPSSDTSLSYAFKSGVGATVNTETAEVTENSDGMITVEYAFTTTKAKLISITDPTAITGVANGTAKTANALGLPLTVAIVTEDTTVTSADVTWDINNASYDPSVLTEQNFDVSGRVTLPTGIDDNNVSLNVTISVTVSAADTAAAPTASPINGTYTENQSVVLSCATHGATIYYTTDGSDPRTNGLLYSEAIHVTGTEGQSVDTVIKAIAVKDGMNDSEIAEFTYTIEIPHSHVASDEYSKDETGHWHTCSGCTEMLDFAAHTYGKWKITVPATAQANGKKERICSVCGYVQEGTVIYGGDDTTGDINNATNPENNALHADLDLTDEDIISKIPLTPEKLELIENGAKLEVYMVVIDYSGKVPAEDKSLAESALKGNMQIGMYIDVSLFKKVGDNEPKPVTATNGDLNITFEMPEKLINTDNTVTREYSIIRVHDRNVDVLDCTFDPATGKASFMTDKFSSYAISFSETVNEELEHASVVKYPIAVSGNVSIDNTSAAAGETVRQSRQMK